MTTIVKIRRDPKSPCNRVNIINEYGSIDIHEPMTPELAHHLKDKDVIFAKVSFSAAKFKLLGLVKNPGW